jgi:nondiscriminating aspartyl-tRNA synthetase
VERIWTSQLAEHAGEIVRLSGWLHRLRRVGSIGFLVLRDAKGTAQVVVEESAELDRVSRLPHESVLTIEGQVVAEPQAPGGFELHAPRVTILVETNAPPPFDLFRPTLRAQLPTILDHAPVALRHLRLRASWRLAAASMEGFRTTLRGLDFVEIQTPKIVAGATESGANVFPIDYFGRLAFLAQSPQLYKQIMVGVFERVFEIGPVFRAEPHDTQRHLNQYVSLDAELGFIDDHRTVMDVLTRVIRGILAQVEREAADAVALLNLTWPTVPERVPIIHFADAQTLLERETGEQIRGDPDLAPAHERWLGEWAQRTYGSDFLFVEGYPMVKRPFYTHPEPGRPEYSNSFDLLFRGIELVTGGQRLHRNADYLAAIQARGLDPAPLAGYLEAFKHGMPPHGGFAIGLERWVSRLTGATNVREAALFPRDINRLTP